MNKHVFLAVGAVALLAMPVSGSAATLQGSFSGHADHDGAAPGVYTGATTYTAYMTLDTTQQDPWYPWNPAKEYTAVLTAPVATYTPGMFQTVTWGVGTVDVYEDDPDADYANRATFTDGTLILTGSAQNMAGQRFDFFGTPWSITGVVVFTAGSGLGNLDAQCAGGLVMNDFIDFQIVAPPATYDENYDALWNCPEPTGAEESSWGRVKSGYQK
jgi:hypothetical protein